MEVEVGVEELRQRKLMVCTPMYGGMCAGTYTKSSTDLATVAAKYGIEVQFFYLFNESLITRARNYCADTFMRSDCTHMIFLDSCLLYTSPSPRDRQKSRMPSSA